VVAGGHPPEGSALRTERRPRRWQDRGVRGTRSELKNPGYEIFIGVLSVLSIVNLALAYLVRGDPALQQVLRAMNALFSVVFLIDFAYRLATAPARLGYFFRGFGWADLLASLPLAQAKFLRVFRLVRVFRLLRRVGGRAVVRTLVQDRAGSALLTLLLLGILVLQFGSLQVLYVEQYAEGANITTASDALWYTVVTISTVGYGDQFPVTNAGRLIGAGIIVLGVGIFGTFTGYLANLFLAPRKRAAEPAAESGGAQEPAAGEDALATLRALVAQPETRLTDVERFLAERRGGSAGAGGPARAG
jgi:voltage-gated potassium channel